MLSCRVELLPILEQGDFTMLFCRRNLSDFSVSNASNLIGVPISEGVQGKKCISMYCIDRNEQRISWAQCCFTT